MDGERTDRRKLKEIGDRQLTTEPPDERRVHLHEQQGMAAEIEKVVLAADALDAKHLLPGLGDLSFDVADRRGVVRVERRPLVARQLDVRVARGRGDGRLTSLLPATAALRELGQP